ncbi:MAG: aldehyde dehydrogenase family protein [Rhizobiaceae bacterium]
MVTPATQILPEKLPMWIGGQQVHTSNSAPNLNPSDIAAILPQAYRGDGSHVRSAVHAAQDALQAWSKTTSEFRHDILLRAATEILATRDRLGVLLASEEGKTLREATAEVVRAGRIFQYFAAEAVRNCGASIDSVRPQISTEIRREPVGVVGIIAPWNFPIAIPAWKIAPALAFGNTVVFKPAEYVPATAWALVDILHRAGLPSGVLNLVFGRGSEVGQAMLETSDINAISFTGSQAVGGMVAKACAQHSRKFQLEMGGKNPLIVLDDADLDRAVSSAIDGAFFSTGQRCTASSRLIVTETIYGQFIERCLERIRGLNTGHALEDNTDIGPVVSQSQLDGILAAVDIARQQGGNIRSDGNSISSNSQGHFLSPILITDTTPDMTINRDEVFGPVASVIRVRDYDEALSVANDTAFGLCAGICTQSLKHASHFKENAKVGMVMVNLPTAGVDYHVPFGGTKASSMGAREQGPAAREFYTQMKTAYTFA